MRQIVLLSHGTLAEGVDRAARMIVGRLDGVRCLSLTEEKGIEAFRDELRALLAGLDAAEPFAVVCDIQGGSPYNAALEVLERMGLLGRVFVVSGLNLPLLLALVMGGCTRQAVEAAISEAAAGIRLFELLEEDEEAL